MENTLRKFYNEIRSKSKVGEYNDLLEVIGKEIDKFTVSKAKKLMIPKSVRKTIKLIGKALDRNKELEKLNITMRDENAADYKFASTSLRGYIIVSYANIKKLFGMPNTVGDAYKIDAEWEFEMNGKVMTIYNYKDGKNYNGKNGMPVSKITEWHIGAGENVDNEIKILAEALGGKAQEA